MERPAPVFHNVEFCLKKIIDLHSLGKSQHSNARKQAVQIRQCLIQAEQYFNAAEVVGLATKPVLLYYGVLSLALAEILMKQDGLSSLDSARGQHAHHGLDLRKSGNPSKSYELATSSAALRAVPLIKGGSERFGTFELWHRSQRDLPTVGPFTRDLENGGQQAGNDVIGIPDDRRANLVPEEGLSLLDCLRSIPAICDNLRMEGITPSYARGSLQATIMLEGKSKIEVAVHPGELDTVQKVLSGFKFSSNLVEYVDALDMSNGCVFDVNIDASRSGQKFLIPSSVQYSANEVMFFTSDRILNEFGNLYASLFILGNYARYFPDEWMNDIEKSSPLSNISHDLLGFVVKRAPLITLNELTRVFHYFN